LLTPLSYGWPARTNAIFEPSGDQSGWLVDWASVAPTSMVPSDAPAPSNSIRSCVVVPVYENTPTYFEPSGFHEANAVCAGVPTRCAVSTSTSRMSSTSQPPADATIFVPSRDSA